MNVVPDLMPTTCPVGSTVAVSGSSLDQTKLTFASSCESVADTRCQARAVAWVSLPRIKTGSGSTLTCTASSRSVGKTQVATVAELNRTDSAAPGPSRMY